MTTSGVTPHARHSSASAYSSANSAGCVYAVSSSGVAVPLRVGETARRAAAVGRCGASSRGAAVERRAEDRLGVSYSSRRHAGVLRALPGEQERRPRGGSRAASRVRDARAVAAARAATRQPSPQLGRRWRDNADAMARCARPAFAVKQTSASVARRGGRRARPRTRAASCGSAARVARRERSRCTRPVGGTARRSAGGAPGASSTHDVRVGAAEAERADAGDARPAAALATASPSSAPRPAARPRGCAGSASRKCRCGGICSCCSASTTLISPAMPAAASRWPMFVLTEPMQQRPVGGAALAEHRAERLHLDRIAERGAGAVRLDVADVARARRRRRASACADHRLLRRAVRRRQPAAAPVLVDGRAANDREDAIAVGHARRAAA